MEPDAPDIQLYTDDPTVGAHQLAVVVERLRLRGFHVAWPALRAWLLAENVDVSELTSEFRIGRRCVSGIDATPITAESDDHLERQTDDIYMQMQVARRLGLDSVSIVGGRRNAVAFDYLLAALTKLTLLAERADMRICLRNAIDTALEQPDDFHRVVASLPAQSRQLTIDFDAAAFHQAVVNPCDVIRAFPRRIARVRLTDIAAGQPATLGDGEINAPAVIEGLTGIVYNGPILLRLEPGPDALDRLQRDVLFVRERF